MSSVGQKLPFADNTFDAILCFAVLEHVSDPFACAKEMARVLKPGGELCASVPFIFEEHGYPEHYYNMTRRGLANLFEGALDIDEQMPGRLCLAPLIRKYVNALPDDLARNVKELTLGELVDGPLDDALHLLGANQISDEMKWRFALGTWLWGSKASAQPTNGSLSVDSS